MEGRANGTRSPKGGKRTSKPAETKYYELHVHGASIFVCLGWVYRVRPAPPLAPRLTGRFRSAHPCKRQSRAKGFPLRSPLPGWRKQLGTAGLAPQ
eukprot:9999913-Alexandrium_andersonii.AAC.1